MMMRSVVNVTVRTTFVVDADGDGLIEISTATMLDNMRYDLAGTSYKTSAMDAVIPLVAQTQVVMATSGTYPRLGDAWDLGTDQQLPAVKRCILNTAMTVCASPAMYGALLGGQR